jgi:hypothetical protein
MPIVTFHGSGVQMSRLVMGWQPIHSHLHFSEQSGGGLINGVCDPAPRQSIGQPSVHQKGVFVVSRQAELGQLNAGVTGLLV